MKGSPHQLVEIDFDSLAEKDAIHFDSFKISRADYPLIFAFGVLFIVVFLQFFTRYALNDSITWTEEAARYLLILVTFGGAIRCQVKNTHITLEFMDQYYGRLKPLILVFVQVITLILLVVVVWSALELIQKTSFQQMASLPFPKYYLYASVMLLLAINGLVITFQIFSYLRSLIKER